MADMKRLSLDSALSERLKGDMRSGGAEGGLGGKGVSGASEGVKNYFGSVWSGLVSGGNTPKGLQLSSNVKRSMV